MAGNKRPLAEEDEGLHPSRKRRLENGENYSELSKLFNDLRDEVREKRDQATILLVKNLNKKSEDRAQKLDYSMTRLIKGVCSGAKAARLGFSVALGEVLRLGFGLEFTVSSVLDKIVALTNPESNASGKSSGEEIRNYLIGRSWAFQAVLQSGVLAKASNDDAKYLFDAVAELASEKEWLRRECGSGLHKFLTSREGSQLKNETVRSLIDSWMSKGLLKSPEGVALWLTAKKLFSEVKLPKDQWHHNNPLSSQERPVLSQILQRNAVETGEETNGGTKKQKQWQSGARQIVPSFAWEVIIGFLYREGESKFAHFWDECVASPMFSSQSSTEKKGLGLQIFTNALADAPAEMLKHVIHPNIIRCILDQRSPQANLSEAAKRAMNSMIARAKREADAADVMLCKLLMAAPTSIDKLMKPAIEPMLATAALENVVGVVISLCRTPGVQNTSDAERARRMLGEVLTAIVRSRRSEPSQFFGEDSLAEWLQVSNLSRQDDYQANDRLLRWLRSNVVAENNPRRPHADYSQELLQGLVHLGYTTPAEKAVPSISATSQAVFREKLTSCLNNLVDLPLEQAIVAPLLIVEALNDSRKHLITEIDETSSAAVKETRKLLKDAAKKAKNPESRTTTRAFQLLLSLGCLEVYAQSPDAVGALQDINTCYQSRSESGDTSEMIVEVLLGFVSKPSVLFRKLAKQIFTAFAPEVTADGLQSMIDILSQKESLAGQQELFQNADEEMEDAETGAVDEDEDEMEDVEDMSDVEIANGQFVDKDDDEEEEEEESDDDSSSEDASVDDGADEDEETAFDRKLADALGTTGMEEDEDEDGSDMDDEQMMALEPHLTTIFKERKKEPKKKENKDARENIINFKNRVLELLGCYLKSQYANPIALDLIHPLVTLSRTTTNSQTAENARKVLEKWFETCKDEKQTPALESSKALFKLLDAVFAEMRLGGSKTHADACSRSSRFLAKILEKMRPEYFEKVWAMYGKLASEWRHDSKSKIHQKIFVDWNNWYIQPPAAVEK